MRNKKRKVARGWLGVFAGALLCILAFPSPARAAYTESPSASINTVTGEITVSTYVYDRAGSDTVRAKIWNEARGETTALWADIPAAGTDQFSGVVQNMSQHDYQSGPYRIEYYLGSDHLASITAPATVPTLDTPLLTIDSTSGEITTSTYVRDRMNTDAVFAKVWNTERGEGTAIWSQLPLTGTADFFSGTVQDLSEHDYRPGQYAVEYYLRTPARDIYLGKTLSTATATAAASVSATTPMFSINSADGTISADLNVTNRMGEDQVFIKVWNVERGEGSAISTAIPSSGTPDRYAGNVQNLAQHGYATGTYHAEIYQYAAGRTEPNERIAFCRASVPASYATAPSGTLPIIQFDNETGAITVSAYVYNRMGSDTVMAKVWNDDRGETTAVWTQVPLTATANYFSGTIQNISDHEYRAGSYTCELYLAESAEPNAARTLIHQCKNTALAPVADAINSTTLVLAYAPESGDFGADLNVINRAGSADVYAKLWHAERGEGTAIWTQVPHVSGDRFSTASLQNISEHEYRYGAYRAKFYLRFPDGQNVYIFASEVDASAPYMQATAATTAPVSIDAATGAISANVNVFNRAGTDIVYAKVWNTARGEATAVWTQLPQQSGDQFSATAFQNASQHEYAYGEYQMELYVVNGTVYTLAGGANANLSAPYMNPTAVAAAPFSINATTGAFAANFNVFNRTGSNDVYAKIWNDASGESTAVWFQVPFSSSNLFTTTTLADLSDFGYAFGGYTAEVYLRRDGADLFIGGAKINVPWPYAYTTTMTVTPASGAINVNGYIGNRYGSTDAYVRIWNEARGESTAVTTKLTASATANYFTGAAIQNRSQHGGATGNYIAELLLDLGGTRIAAGRLSAESATIYTTTNTMSVNEDTGVIRVDAFIYGRAYSTNVQAKVWNAARGEETAVWTKLPRTNYRYNGSNQNISQHGYAQGLYIAEIYYDDIYIATETATANVPYALGSNLAVADTTGVITSNVYAYARYGSTTVYAKTWNAARGIDTATWTRVPLNSSPRFNSTTQNQSQHEYAAGMYITEYYVMIDEQYYLLSTAVAPSLEAYAATAGMTINAETGAMAANVYVYARENSNNVYLKSWNVARGESTAVWTKIPSHSTANRFAGGTLNISQHEYASGEYRFEYYLVNGELYKKIATLTRSAAPQYTTVARASANADGAISCNVYAYNRRNVNTIYAKIWNIQRGEATAVWSAVPQNTVPRFTTTAATMQNISQHAYATGPYMVEFYHRANETDHRIGAVGLTVLAPNAVTRGVNTAQMSIDEATGGINIAANVYNRNGTQVVKAKVWNAARGEETAIWKNVPRSTDQFSGTIQNISEHGHADGTYIAELYAYYETAPDLYVPLGRSQWCVGGPYGGTSALVINDTTGEIRANIYAYNRGGSNVVHAKIWNEARGEATAVWTAVPRLNTSSDQFTGVVQNVSTHGFADGAYRVEYYLVRDGTYIHLSAARATAASTFATGPRLTVNDETGAINCDLLTVINRVGSNVVRAKVWNTARGEETAIWTTVPQNGSDRFTKSALQNVSQHGYAQGEYQAEFYVQIDATYRYICAVTAAAKGNYATAPSSSVNAETGVIRVRANALNRNGVNTVFVKVWNDARGEGTAIWTSAPQSSSDLFQSATQNISQHGYGFGAYTMEIYLRTDAGDVFLAMTKATVEPTTVTSPIISINATTGVISTNASVTNRLGVDDVYVRVWNTTRGRDSAVEKKLTRSVDRFSSTAQNVSDHKYSAGVYHAEFFQKFGDEDRTIGTASATVGVTLPSITISPAPRVNSFTVTITGFLSLNSTVHPALSAWTEANGNDDVIWTDMELASEETYKATVYLWDHEEGGLYEIDVFAANASGAHLVSVQTASCEAIFDDGLPTADGMTITPNPATGYFRAVVHGVADDFGIEKVEFEVWSDADGSDDLVVYPGQEYEEGIYQVLVYAPNHNNVTGPYTVEAYATDGGKNRGLIATGTVDVILIPQPGTGGTAPGVTESFHRDGEDWYRIIITSDGTFSSEFAIRNATVIAIGGGGRGGNASAGAVYWESGYGDWPYAGGNGGGGGGGYIQTRTMNIPKQSSYSVTIGAGGDDPAQGGITTGFGLTAQGGGRGGNGSIEPYSYTQGNNVIHRHRTVHGAGGAGDPNGSGRDGGSNVYGYGTGGKGGAGYECVWSDFFNEWQPRSGGKGSAGQHGAIILEFPRSAIEIPVDVTVIGNGTSSRGTGYYAYGDWLDFTFTPHTKHKVKGVTFNGEDQGEVTSYITPNLYSAATLTVEFERIPPMLTVEQAAHGTISPGSGSIPLRGTRTFAITPDPGYGVYAVLYNGEPVTASTAFTTPPVLDDSVVTAIFKPLYDVSVSVEPSAGGTAELSATSAMDGETVTCNITPAEGYEIGALYVNGVPCAPSETLLETITQNTEIRVVFQRIKHTVTVVTNGHGRVTPGTTQVEHGDNVTFEITPDDGYGIVRMKFKAETEGSLVARPTYTTPAIRTDSVFTVEFGRANDFKPKSDSLIPDIARVDVPMFFTATIENIGSAAAGVNVELVLKRKGDPAAAPQKLTTAVDLPADGTAPAFFDWTPTVIAEYDVTLTVNPGDSLYEGNYANNTLETDVRVLSAADYEKEMNEREKDWEENGTLYWARLHFAVEYTQPRTGQLKSGYGFEVAVTTSVEHNYYNEERIGEPQQIIMYTPESEYDDHVLLEKQADGSWKLPVNTGSVIGARRWYIPVEYADGTYEPIFTAYGTMTPGGELSASERLPLTVKGSMYDDDFAVNRE